MMLCYLALGSNLRAPQRQIRQAIDNLRNVPKTHIIKIAGFYSSKAWGRKVQPHFCNTVVAIQTSLTAETLLIECQKIESAQGRLRLLKWGARTIDIDILLYGLKKIHKPGLIIPHPQMLQRDFVLTPLLEIAPLVCLPNGQYVARSCGRQAIDMLKKRP